LQRRGPVEKTEMYRVFNMGIGYVLVAAPDFADAIQDKLTRSGETVYRIGHIAPER
jgi:phosphoribosylformylglycinamidine cyclo-ligase